MGDAGSLRSQLYKLATKAWMSGVTPGSVIRALGPWGPGLVEKYVTGRFSMHGGLLRVDGWCCKASATHTPVPQTGPEQSAVGTVLQ